MRKLTFGDDQSAGSDLAWQWIVHQNWPDWILDIISVESNGHPTEDSPLGYDALREIRPAEPRDLPASAGFAEVHYLTARHDPRVVLGNCPDSTMLVVGPRGKGFLKALHIGSTAEWLMQCPSTPLVIAREGVPVTRIFVAVDGSSHADTAVDLLATLPFINGAHVAVVGIVEEENQIRSKVEAAANQLAAANASVNAILVEPDPLVLTINPRASLLEVIEREQPHLVVMGTKGMTGLKRVRVGSVASAVTHHVDCSVMLVRDTGADDTI
jgi:nucleotide-binding universal stress UspA family protein